MRVRILMSIVGDRFSFQPSQILTFASDDVPPDVEAWLQVPLADGRYRAERIEEARVGPMETAARRVRKRVRP